MAWRGSRARGVFRALACIVFSSERPCLRSPVAAVRQALVRMLTWRSYPPGNRTVRLSWRRLSQNMGATARCRGSLEPSPRAPGDGRERLARAPSRRAPPRGDRRRRTKTHDGTIVTDKVKEMWGTDMSQIVTLEEGRAYVFVAVEHANSEIVGIHAARSANRFEALEPVRQGVHRCFGAIAPGVARGLKLRHDHGSNYMSGDFQDQIKCLGIEASPSFVREPEGNGVAERFIRTLKENLLWVRAFKTIEELRAELVAFASRYNETWLVARHGYKTPARVREQQTMPQIAIDPTFAATLPLAA